MNPLSFIRITFAILLFATSISCIAQETIKPFSDEEIYYTGINPVAPFTGIRSEFTSAYLPYFSNQETGVALVIGKIWNNRYNVETRLSFGSPNTSYNLLLVQSGVNYCFVSRKRGWHPYAGMFLKLYLLHEQPTKTDYVSTILYADAGNRFNWKNFFIDLRINENITALSWKNQPGTKAQTNFHPSLYKGKSPYIPFMAITAGVYFK